MPFSVLAVDWSAFGDFASRALTIVGSAAVAWLTATQATKSTKITSETQERIESTRSRAQVEDDAYLRAEGYWQAALRDARRELDDEKRERREEVDLLNQALATERRERREETAELRRQVTAEQVRARRAEDAVRVMARRRGDPEPDL